MQFLTSKENNLTSPPDKPINTMPVNTSNIILPFHDLSWENFEKFCYQLGCREMECLGTSYIYGRSGQKQDGIDIYFRNESTKEVWQIKRYDSFGAADIANAVSTFISGKWYGKANEFTLCVSSYLDDTHIVDEIDKQADLLSKNNIVFSVLNSEKLTIMAKQHPELIEIFFGKCWLEALGIASISSNRVMYDIEPVAVNALLVGKLKELGIPAGLVAFNLLLKQLNNLLTDLPFMSLAVLVLNITLWIFIPVLTFCILWEIISILSLNKIGKICCFYSKLSILASCLECIKGGDYSVHFSLSKVFKNEHNVIYEIKGCNCTRCQSEPIGYMHPRRKNSNSIVFVCNQNSDHRKGMDPKEKLL